MREIFPFLLCPLKCAFSYTPKILFFKYFAASLLRTTQNMLTKIESNYASSLLCFSFFFFLLVEPEEKRTLMNCVTFFILPFVHFELILSSWSCSLAAHNRSSFLHSFIHSFTRDTSHARFFLLTYPIYNKSFIFFALLFRLYFFLFLFLFSALIFSTKVKFCPDFPVFFFHYARNK